MPVVITDFEVVSAPETLETLRRSITHLEGKMRGLEARAQELEESNKKLQGRLTRVTDHVRVDSNGAVTLSSAERLVISAPTIRINGPGLGAKVSIDSREFEIDSVDIKLEGSTLKAYAGRIDVGSSMQTTFAASGNLVLNGGSCAINSGDVKLNASKVEATSLFKCQTMIAASVVGSSYTPGAGNIW